MFLFSCLPSTVLKNGWRSLTGCCPGYRPTVNAWSLDLNTQISKIGQSSSLEEPSHTSSVTFLNRSEIFVNILEHSGAQQNAYKPGFPHVFLSLLHRLRESQWILLGMKITNGKTKNHPRQKVKRRCWKRVRWSVFPLSNAVFVKNSVTGGGDGNTSPGRLSRFYLLGASVPSYESTFTRIGGNQSKSLVLHLHYILRK